VDQLSIRFSVLYNVNQSWKVYHFSPTTPFDISPNSELQVPWKNLFDGVGQIDFNEIQSDRAECKVAIDISYTSVFGKSYTFSDRRFRGYKGDWRNDPTAFRLQS
jgi:hypothetical protein